MPFSVRARNEIIDHPYVTHPVESYFWHQGEKLVIRFDANSYLRIIDAWTNYELLDDTGAASHVEALSPCVQQSWHVFTIDTDICFYPDEQAALVEALEDRGSSGGMDQSLIAERPRCVLNRTPSVSGCIAEGLGLEATGCSKFEPQTSNLLFLTPEACRAPLRVFGLCCRGVRRRR